MGASTHEGDHTLHRLPGRASSREESKDCQFAYMWLTYCEYYYTFEKSQLRKIYLFDQRRIGRFDSRLAPNHPAPVRTQRLQRPLKRTALRNSCFILIRIEHPAYLFKEILHADGLALIAVKPFSQHRLTVVAHS